ncbi:MAG: TIGR04388 family protein [Spirochaetia bacterium]|nr:TIGR04388 family protein [Spirochaetia bacterium]
MKPFRLVFVANLLLFSLVGLIGQPAPVPQLQPPAFNSQDLNPTISQAQGAQSQAAWETIVQGGLAGLRATWEAVVTAQINTELLNVTQSDSVNSQVDYQNYVRSALLSQMSAAEASWTSAAQTTIQTERQTFIASLSTADLKEAEQDAKTQADALLNATAPTQNSDVFKDAAQQVADAKAAYEKGFNAQLANGLNQFGAAQGALDQNFNSFIAGLNQTEQEYQQNLQGIQAAEGNVRNAISTQVQGMQSYLQSSQLFYNTTCDAQGNNCVSAMNQAGTDLLTVITSIQTALQQNAPLSQVTQTMVNYLTAQENVAYTTEQTWQSQVDINYNDSATLSFYGNWGNLYVDPQFGNVQAYIDGNQQPLLTQLGGVGKTVTINSIQLQGYSASHNPPFPIVFNTWETNHIYLPNDGFPFQWGANGAICFVICIPQGGGYAEDSVIKTLTYHVHDSIAESNAQTWGGYKNDLSAALATFTGLQQASANWEVQVSQYQAQHAAWLATAQQDLITEQQAYDTASTQLMQSKNTWLQSMSDAHKVADAQWQTVALDLAAAQNATQGGDPKAQQEAAKAVLAGLPAYTPVQQPNLANLISIVNSVPSSSTHANDSAAIGLPDFSLISNLENKFGETLGGLSNLAIAKTASDEAEHMKSDAVKSMITSAKAQADALALSIAHPEWSGDQITAEVQKNIAEGKVSDSSIQVTTDASGRITLTRAVANGQAALNDGGDPTNAEAYHPVLAQQTIHIAPPPTQKLASTGSLFSEWNLQSILDAQNDYQKQTEESMNRQSEVLEAANKVVGDNLQAFSKEAQKKAADAAQIKSLLTALLTGGTFESWAQGQVRGQIADAISAATGFPSGFLSGLMGGMKPHEAAASYAESLAYQHLGEAIGNADLASMLQTQLSQAAAKKAKTKAAQLKPEDLILGAVTYTMRNAAYNPKLAKVDQAISSIPIAGAIWGLGKGMYQASLAGKGLGGALQAGLDGVVGIVTNLGDTFGSWVTGDYKGAVAHLGAATTGVPLDKLKKDFGITKLDNVAKLGAYTGLDVLAKDIKIATKVYGNMAEKVATQIQYNTLKGAADLAGNDRLKESMKMKANGDYAAASDFTKNLGFGARGGIMQLAFASGNPFVVVGSAILMANDKVFSRIEKGLVATYAQHPMLMDATTGLIGGGAYTAWKVREGWIRGGDKGALVAAGSLALQAIPGFAALAGASTATVASLEFVSGSMSYTHEGGFSASLGYGPGSGKLGGALTYSDRNGLGVSFNAGDADGLSGSVGYSVRGGLSVSGSYGQKDGPAFGLSYDRASGFGANISHNFKGDAGRMPAGLGVNAGISQHGGITAGIKYSGKASSRYGENGIGLSYTRGWDGEDSLSVSMSTKGVNVGTLTDRGVGTINPTLLHDYAQAMDQAQKQAELDKGRRDRIKELTGKDYSAAAWANLTEAQREAELTALHNKELALRIQNGESPPRDMEASRGDGILDDFFGDIQDGMHELAGGGLGDRWGYIDTNGKYQSRTCFTRGTLVLVAPQTRGAFVKNHKHYKEIQDIRSGDTVIAWNEKTGALTYSKVQETFVRTTPEIYRVTSLDGTSLETTWSHRFYVAGKGWVKGRDLRAGMLIPTIAAIARHNERVTMADGHKFPVKTVSFTGSETGKGKEAVFLPAELPGSATISTVEMIPRTVTVYNFSVAEAHDYFVGEGESLVHNDDPYGSFGLGLRMACDDGPACMNETSANLAKASAVAAAVEVGVVACAAGGCPALYLFATANSITIGEAIAAIVAGDAYMGGPGSQVIKNELKVVLGDVKVLGKAYRKEIDFAKELASKGNNVIVRGSQAEGYDFVVNGVRYEFKTLESASINAVRNNLGKAKYQSDRVIVDGRSAGLSHADAIRAVQQQVQSGRMGALKEVKILTSSGEYVWVKP